MHSRIHHLAVWILVVIHQFVGFGRYSVFGDLWLNGQVLGAWRRST